MFLLVAIAATGFSQNATTSLRGVIKDSTGAVVPGAKITLTDHTTGRLLVATSGPSGEYQFLQILPAKYDITVSAPGFGNQTKSAELLVNQPASIDFSMTVQASQEIVNVSAEAQTLNTSDASLGDSVNNAMIQALPSYGRNVPDLLTLQPGVLYLGQDRGGPNTNLMNDPRTGAVNGGRSDQGNITVDGLDDNDQVNGYAFLGVLRETQDSVEEFRVTTGMADATAGRSSGAQVSMVTKSGTNRFHGAAYEYYRPTFTVANDWFNKQSQLESGQQNIPPKVVLNTFGADVGGPIIKDKLFFFGNYEGKRQAVNKVVSRTVPTSTFQAGELLYSTGNGTATGTITPAQLQVLDGACQICNTPEYPYGPGANPNVLSYLGQYPAANGTLLGDGGYNYGSFTFSSPNGQTLNTSIAKIDWTPTQKQHIFVRGNLQKDTLNGVEQFPGQPPSSRLEDNTKGIAAGDTWTISPTMVNDIRYGYIRQGNSTVGIGTGDYVDFRFMDTLTAETRTTINSTPVNNIVDNFSWSRGKHNIQVGGNWRLVHQNHSTDENSFNSATSNPYWLGGQPPSPDTPPVDDSFSNSYGIAYANLVGTIPQVNVTSNYQVTSPSTGALLPEGAFINRHFKANEYEYYLQDSWRAMPNLTLTFGIRQTILQTPWETDGQQVAPTIDTHNWYMQRESAALQGQVYEQDLDFSPNGPYYNKPGYWAKAKNNIAPRLAIAYAPNPKTSIRAGFGIYYDHYGEALVNLFDQNGSFGLGSVVSNPAGVYTYSAYPKKLPSPRYIDRRTFPNIPTPPIATTQTYPYPAPEGNFAITWGLDSKQKTPYTEAFNLSVQRELPGGFTFEAVYLGRLGRHLLQALDLAEPVDFVDTNGGGDYYTAGSKLSHLVDLNGGNFGIITDANGNPIGSAVPVPTIRYFEDVFPFMQNIDYQGESATQAIYNNEWAPYRAQYGATTALSDIDFYCFYGCPAGYQSKFWQDQFSSLYAQSTIGMSYYNAAQFILRHPSSHGLQMDFSYTYSSSIDMGSDVERASEITAAGSFSNILNTWKPYLNRARSDFDTHHLITTDWVYQLPFGRGQRFAGGVNNAVNAIIGGWQWSGIERWSSGLPFSLLEPGWTTDWQIESYAVTTQKVKTRFHLDSNGNPQAFDNAAAINNGVSTGSPVRLPYPGEAGQRNNFRGQGIFNIDNGLAKSWGFREYGTLKFSAEVFNITNTPRFDVAEVGSGLTGGNLGVYGTPSLAQYRLMQFSLRYDF